jgi:hypothetical protein
MTTALTFPVEQSPMAAIWRQLQVPLTQFDNGRYRRVITLVSLILGYDTVVALYYTLSLAIRTILSSFLSLLSPSYIINMNQ